MSSFYKLNIKEVKRETAQAVSVLFNVPAELESNYKFIAGQYINLKLTLDGKEIRRAYSICSSPESGELRIAIKSVSQGAFSQFANTKLKAGDALEVGAPEGKFTFEPDGPIEKLCRFCSRKRNNSRNVNHSNGFEKRTEKHFCIGLWK